MPGKIYRHSNQSHHSTYQRNVHIKKYLIPIDDIHTQSFTSLRNYVQA